ncbi:MAG: lysostaphin resistance A-like protein [Acidimicrobiales bacterium]
MPEPDQTVTAPAGRAQVRWGLGDAVVGWLLGLVGTAIGFELVFALSGTNRDDADSLPLGWLAVAQLGLWFGLLGVPLVVSRLKGNGTVSDFGLSASRSDLGVGVLVGVIAQWAIVWIVYLPMRLLTDISSSDITEPARELTDRATDPIGVILLVAIVGIGAPIVEEIFYRGLLQRSLVRRLGQPLGVGIAALVFAVSHFQALQLPALFVFGIVLGVLAERYGRLGPAIFAHMVFNMTAVVSLLAGS